MKIKLSLISIFFRQALIITIPMMCLLSIFVLFYHEVLTWRNIWVSLFILMHSVLLVGCLGQYRSRSFAFIYTRGFTRDQLWVHKMLAMMLAIFSVWMPAALIVWLPVRSYVQDFIFRSPYGSFMPVLEVPVPIFWLFLYVILSSVFHYVWIRGAQPTKGSNGAVLLAGGVVAAAALLMNFRWHLEWFKVVVWLVSGVIVVTALTGGFLLHRRLEVRE